MPAVIDRNATPVAIKSDTTQVVQQPRLLDQVRNGLPRLCVKNENLRSATRFR